MTAATATPAAPTTNAGAYMKSTLFSMISITLAMSVGKWLTGQEEYVPCSTHVNDNSWLGDTRYQSLRMFDPQLTHHETQYVPVRDKTELAVDTYVSEYVWNNQLKVPTVISYTRHGRGYQVDFPFNVFTQYDKKFVNPRSSVYISRFITAGYAWISVDVRGTGVSGGTKKHDFSDQEIEDGYDIIDWIVQQPWSNGKVAAIGHGFEGGGALLLAASAHPALKAISLNGSPIDAFNGAFFPGGVKNAKALSDFSSFTYATDRQIRWDDIPEFKARLMMKHFGGNVYRVNDDESKFQQHIQAHLHNPILADELANISFRDDMMPNVGVTFQELDMIRHMGKIATSGVAIHAFGGYYDMGVAHSSILLFQYLTNQLDEDTKTLFPPLPSGVHTTHHRLSLGPWSHAGIDNSDPFAQSKQKCFWHLDEITRFFDYHLFENRQEMTQMEKEEPIHYFTLVHNRWKQTSTWPPAHVSGEPLEYYLGSNHSMTESYQPEGQVTLDVQFNPLYNIASRWDMIAHLFGQRPNYYHDRAPMEDQYATFLTPELSLMEITGQVELRAWISVDKPAVNLVAYLEDSDYTPAFANENKRRGVTYITEALINPIHTPVRSGSSVYSFMKKDSRVITPGQVYEVVFVFQPISYVVKSGHQLRVSIGVATPKEFGPAGEEEATKVTVHYGGDYPSVLKVPVYLGVHTANVVPREEEIVESTHTKTQAPPETSEADEFADEKEEL